jgi:energy-coupling factor transporter ATP-binding protein EcfA2
MKIHELEIRNFRSLESVQLTGLGKFNVLIGRNNSGKSSVLNSLRFLYESLRGVTPLWSSVITGGDTTRAFELRLVADITPDERQELSLFLGPPVPDERRTNILNSPFLRQVEFLFRSPTQENAFPHLAQTQILAQNGQWVTIQRAVGNSDGNTTLSESVLLQEMARAFSDDMNFNLIGFGSRPTHQRQSTLPNTLAAQTFSTRDPILDWLIIRLTNYLGHAFFFNPFRHSRQRMSVHQTHQLAQDGENLVQRLHTINSNDRSLFNQIESFIHSALPGVGALQTPLVGSDTEIAFLTEGGTYPVRLQDMGGGVEQLLMVATVLLTTNDESALFIEEPESHLHAGAQRFLIEKLAEGERQIFITTHSPIFINTSLPTNLYQVKYGPQRSKVNKVRDTSGLSAVLSDIGSRNSDVLLSDAVVFVEGPSDRRVLAIWSELIGLHLGEHNITVVPMGGGEHAERGARIRSDVLEAVSQKSQVPHLFIIDRDERSPAEIKKLKSALGDRLILLQRRELENYLLVPRAISAALISKHGDDEPIRAQVEVVSNEQLENDLSIAADGLRGLVLMKRIRSSLGGLTGGIMPRDLCQNLASQADNEDLDTLLMSHIEKRVKTQISQVKLAQIIGRERKSLDKIWKTPSQRLVIAPGTEILEAVFRKYGSDYKKPQDTERIARQMVRSEIPVEMEGIIKKISNLGEQLYVM